MATEAVDVRAPPQQPRLIAGSKRKIYLPINGASSIGTAVAKRPQKKMPKPASLRPATKVGPELIPTTAMKTLRPTEFMNQRVG
jgi:hypothetical protein